jgi:hypothetical protein
MLMGEGKCTGADDDDFDTGLWLWAGVVGAFGAIGF